MSETIESIARQWTLVQPSVATFISSLIPNNHDAQDVLQDVAAVIFSQKNSQTPPNSFQAYVIGIARHKIVDFYRRRANRNLPILLDSDTLDYLERANQLISDEIEARRKALHHCISLMPPKSRDLVEKHYKLDLSCAEIASTSRMGLSAVKTSLHRIRAALRKCIDQQLSLSGESA